MGQAVPMLLLPVHAQRVLRRQSHQGEGRAVPCRAGLRNTQARSNCWSHLCCDEMQDWKLVICVIHDPNFMCVG